MSSDALLPMKAPKSRPAKEGVSGRPDFIPSEVFRGFVSQHQMGKHCRIGGLTVAGYVGRCERLGRPIKSSQRGHVRLIDIFARARADGLAVTPPPTDELRLSIEELRNEHARLTEEVHEARHRANLNETALDLVGSALLREDEIVASSQAVDAASGVYFLIQDARVVYVGQSVNVYARIMAHKESAKAFDRWAAIPCRKDQLDLIESLYIHLFRPAYNGTMDERKMVAPIRLDRLRSA